MKIKKANKIINFSKNIFKIRQWCDYDRVQASTVYIVRGLSRLFIPRRNSAAAESFDAAVARMRLSPQELTSKQNSLYTLSILMCCIAAVILGYAFFQLYYGAMRVFLICIILTLIALALAFRYHFWYYQIKMRKLGCSFREWYRQGLRGLNNE